MEKVVVEAVKVAREENPLSLHVFVEDSEDWELSKKFLALEERMEIPWSFAVDLRPKENEFDAEVELRVSKPEFSLLELKVVFPLSAWTFAKEMVSVFFFQKLKRGDLFVKEEGIAFKMPPELIEDIEREIENFGLELFYDKVLRVGNPYSPEYVEGVYESFVIGRYLGQWE